MYSAGTQGDAGDDTLARGLITLEQFYEACSRLVNQYLDTSESGSIALSMKSNVRNLSSSNPALSVGGEWLFQQQSLRLTMTHPE